MICAKCNGEFPDAEFAWDDGILQGVAKRCRACRAHRNCPDCKPARKCDQHRGAFRKPGFPEIRYRVRDHALVRFWERVRPDLVRRSEVLEEMLRLAIDAPETTDPPDWLPYRKNAPWYSCGYLHVTDGIAFTLNSYRHRGIEITTVLTRDRAELPTDHPRPRWVETIEAGRIAHIERNAKRRAERQSA